MCAVYGLLKAQVIHVHISPDPHYHLRSDSTHPLHPINTLVINHYHTPNVDLCDFSVTKFVQLTDC